MSLSASDAQFIKYLTQIIGNLLNILVSLRKSIFKSNMGFYNILMSTLNISTVIISYVEYLLLIIGFSNLSVISNYGCILIYYTDHIVIRMSSWINVMVSMDRLASIFFPFKYKFLKNKKALLLIVLGLFLIMIVLCIPNVFFRVVSIQTQKVFNLTINQTVTTRSCTTTQVIYLVTRTVLPVILQITASIIIIQKLVKSRRTVNVSASMKN